MVTGRTRFRFSNRFGDVFNFNSGENLSNRLKARIAELLDEVAKYLPYELYMHSQRSCARSYTPDVLKTKTGKVTTATERQGTTTQERQE